MTPRGRQCCRRVQPTDRPRPPSTARTVDEVRDAIADVLRPSSATESSTSGQRVHRHRPCLTALAPCPATTVGLEPGPPELLRTMLLSLCARDTAQPRSSFSIATSTCLTRGPTAYRRNSRRCLRISSPTSRVRRGRPPAKSVLARVAGTVVGQVPLLRHDDDTGRLERTCVTDSFQRNGIGAHLLHHALDLARWLGYRRIVVLDVIAEEPPARRSPV